MKNRYMFLFMVTSVLLLGGIQPALTQIPNASFEDWTNNEPDNWSTSNIQGTIMNNTQSSDAHAGSSSIAGVVGNFGGFAWPPTVMSGSDGNGFPVSAQHAALHGWYKFSPVGGDFLLVNLLMSHADSGVGAGSFSTVDAENVYREFVADVFYISGQTPDTCFISISIFGSGGLPTVGSSFIIDDLQFGVSTDVDQYGNVLPSSFELRQNYPNPFNPRTMIQYSLPKAVNVQLKVYNALGNEISMLVNQRQDAGSYRAEFNADGLPSGMYFYRLQAGEFSQVKKLMLMK